MQALEEERAAPSPAHPCSPTAAPGDAAADGGRAEAGEPPAAGAAAKGPVTFFIGEDQQGDEQQSEEEAQPSVPKAMEWRGKLGQRPSGEATWQSDGGMPRRERWDTITDSGDADADEDQEQQQPSENTADQLSDAIARELKARGDERSLEELRQHGMNMVQGFYEKGTFDPCLARALMGSPTTVPDPVPAGRKRAKARGGKKR